MLKAIQLNAGSLKFVNHANFPVDITAYRGNKLSLPGLRLGAHSEVEVIFLDSAAPNKIRFFRPPEVGTGFELEIPDILGVRDLETIGNSHKSLTHGTFNIREKKEYLLTHLAIAFKP